uniref:uncharacterized protein si:dkey-79f11.4 n=1 Tax=Epinephelus lanceolatus TaxID=310571 RepID=UPI0014480CC5|nr:uncharacterized protein si:dkey-79f11.4 [Epinephelus lanceolatus]
MGLDKETSKGANVEDIKLAMMGHIKDGYTTFNILSDEHVKKMRDVRLAARDMGIPEVAILTQIDKVCPEVKKDIKNVYKRKYLKKQMERFSVALGTPLYCIFPVKNYDSEIDTDDDTDTLVLSALRQIINFGDDFVINL